MASTDLNSSNNPNSGVFSIFTSVTINAPRERVWSVLLDFKSYQEWNPFVRSQIPLDASMKPLADGKTLEVGNYLILEVHIPPTMDDGVKRSHSTELVTVLHHDVFQVEWTLVPPIPWGLHAHRTQKLSDVDGKTKYETRETFSGPVAHLLRFFMKKDLDASFNAMAHALKARSELDLAE